ncbi:helix-turn-helix protein [Rahnella sp. JUb53]|nr:helix-turn-helix protein [Rahnella sp. JUb53]
MSSFYAVRRLCLVLGLHHSGYYQWLKRPKSLRTRQDERQTGLIKQLWLESGTVYGYRKIWLDMKDLGECVGRNRIARLMRLAELASQTGYRKRRYYDGGKPSFASPNYLERQFVVPTPNTHWVSDMTYSVPGVQGEHGRSNEPRVCLEY